MLDGLSFLAIIILCLKAVCIIAACSLFIASGQINIVDLLKYRHHKATVIQPLILIHFQRFPDSSSPPIHIKPIRHSVHNIIRSNQSISPIRKSLWTLPPPLRSSLAPASAKSLTPHYYHDRLRFTYWQLIRQYLHSLRKRTAGWLLAKSNSQSHNEYWRTWNKR